MTRTGENLRLAGRIVEHESSQMLPVGIEPMMLGLSSPTLPARLWPTCPGRRPHCYYHSGPKADWGGIANLQVRTRAALLPFSRVRKRAGDASPCHIHICVCSPSGSRGREGRGWIGDRLESWERLLERESILAWALVWPRVGSEEPACM